MSNSQDRLFEVIGLLRRATTPLSLTEIARDLHMAPSSAHAIVNVLLRQGVVVIDRDKRYRLGPAIFYLGASYARSTPIYRAVWAELLRTAHDLNLAATIAVPWEDHHLILAVHQNGGPAIGLGIGSRVPLQGGSFGKAYYAWSGAKVPRRLTRFTGATIVKSTEFARELERTKQRGYAIDKEEFVSGVGAVAAGVTSENGYEGLAGLFGSIERFRELSFERAGGSLAALAVRASVILGDRKRERMWGSAR
jgi:DNA-binding IclR family transcriptional regulator